MEESPSYEATSHSPGQEIPRLLCKQKFHYLFKTARHWILLWPR